MKVSPQNRPQTSKISNVRIIGGKWRSRRITFPGVEGLRPSADRVRETLFNWLPDLKGMVCLDLFAGSGVLGLEALSRGASQVIAVDSQRAVTEQLRKTATQLDTGPGYTIKQGLAEQFLTASGNRFDLVFLDPPFADFSLAKIWHLLEDKLALSAWIYVEQRDVPHFPDYLTPWREGKAGQVRYYLLRYRPNA